MKRAGIRGVTRGRFKTATTGRDAKARPAPDLVKRDFSVDGPGQLSVADITHVRTWAAWSYLDARNRRVVGWAMAPYMRTELDESALALSRRKPEGRVIHHKTNRP